MPISEILLSAFGNLINSHKNCHIFHRSWKDNHKDYITDMVKLIHV